MCLIAYRPDVNFHITDEVIEHNMRVNDDGFGLAWRDEDGMHFIKYAPDEHKAFLKKLRKIDALPVEYVAHWRMGTRGKKDRGNAHPFSYTDPEHGEVLVFHNGVISIGGDADKSDTRLFVEGVLQHLPSGWWKVPALVFLVEAAIGYSRLLIMTASGEVARLDGGNTTLWNETGGIWYSTTAAPKSYSKSGSNWGQGSRGTYSYPATSTKKDEDKATNVTPYVGASCAVGGSDDDSDEDYQQWWEKQSGKLEDKTSNIEYGKKAGKGVVKVNATGNDWDGLSWLHVGHPVEPLDEMAPDSQGNIAGECWCPKCDTTGTYFSMNGKVYIELSHVLGEDEDDEDERTAIMSEEFLREAGAILIGPGSDMERDTEVLLPQMVR